MKITLNKEDINKFDKMINSLYPNIYSLVIRQSGYVVFENYYRNTNQDCRRNVMSVTKSILSALLGIAIDDNLLIDENVRIIDIFPEYLTGDCDPNVLRIKIKHLLNMTSGLYYQRLAGDSQPVSTRRNSYDDWIGYMLSLPVVDRNLETFCYSNFNADLIAAVINECIDTDILTFANNNLFSHLGFEISEWPFADPMNKIVDNISMTTNEMAIFGELYLYKGLFGKKQIISKNWVQKSTNNYGNNYGYLWWIEEGGAFFASGAGGSLIYVEPYRETVLAMQAKHLKTNWKSPISLIKEILL